MSQTEWFSKKSFQCSTANLSTGCVKMIKKWSIQGVMEDIESSFGTNAEAIVNSLSEELLKIAKPKVNF